MADAFRGGRLFTANNALAALVQEPQLLDQARARFSESPPSYRSVLSHNSTRSQSTEVQSDEQERYYERKWQLIREHRASFPSSQLKDQQSEEVDRLYHQEDTSRTICYPPGTDFYKLAKENVKKRWVEQGIWNKRWETGHVWRWKHEEPLDADSDSDADSNDDEMTDAERARWLFGPPVELKQSKPRQPKSPEELQSIEERRRKREIEREASRPYHQFVYLISKERQQILDDMSLPGTSNVPGLSQANPFQHQAAREARAGRDRSPNEPNAQNPMATSPPDINTTAYERVKSKWVRRGIWNDKWGILPGMSWKHEQSIEDMVREEIGSSPPPPEVEPVEDRREISYSPRRVLFGPSSTGEQVISSVSGPLINGNHESPARVSVEPGQVTPPLPVVTDGHVDEPHKEPSLGSDPVGSSTGDASVSSIAPSSERYQEKRGDAERSILPSGVQRDERERSAEAGPASDVPRTALGPVRPSKISKAYRRSGASTRRRPPGSGINEVLEPVSASDVASGPTGESSVQPRRSRRLQEAKRTADESPSGGRTRTSSAKPAKSAKPRGVVKRRSRKSGQKTR